ncbi:MAG TPA: 1-deoxy-D-xylulose-5-phosphate reductoisomerase [Elusimicrobia bacterium]|nr:1-deoxy-D-xylulose-5-phosphate reductoisomerase [Elusimicrobiota bacterium]HBT61696.1 1-deoxy-D-xylulose-5-phosphate reductoisomerase [Elusimicrobiota bacterium]
MKKTPASRPKRIAILGSTGSIGLSALSVIEAMPGAFEVAGLAAHSNGGLLLKQARKHKPAMISLFDHACAEKLARRCCGARRLGSGVDGLVEMASHPDVDVVLTSLVGGVGFAPLLAAIRAGKTVALANKEPMVMAGAQFMNEARRWEARIIPVDSEPSAIFQCVHGQLGQAVRRVLLTASGGAFYRRQGSLDRVTVAEALRHPTWKMGRKITIDSATLMNKGFESIEIMNLFGLGRDQVEIVIHPQSIVHSCVEFSDGSVLAQMSPPDMRLPIQYALTYPERAVRVVERLDLAKAGELTFREPDFRRFPCLALARQAARDGGGMPAVLNAADEVAVEAFVAGRIRFTDIARVVERGMKAFRGSGRLPGFSEVVEIDQWARRKAQEVCVRL